MSLPLSVLLGAAVLLMACGGKEGAFPGCSIEGNAVSRRTRVLNRLKNRAVAPAPRDVDSTLTLDALLAPGDDRDRWSEQRAATIVGYVRSVSVGGVESVNCLARATDHRDTHIELIADPAAGGELPLIVEVTPGWRAGAAGRGGGWSTDALRAGLVGRWVRVTGWLLFDREHEREAENTAPGRVGNWRQTAWEIHPVTRLEVIPDRGP